MPNCAAGERLNLSIDGGERKDRERKQLTRRDTANPLVPTQKLPSAHAEAPFFLLRVGLATFAFALRLIGSAALPFPMGWADSTTGRGPAELNATGIPRRESWEKTTGRIPLHPETPSPQPECQKRLPFCPGDARVPLHHGVTYTPLYGQTQYS